MMDTKLFDRLIIGSGIAGLSSAKTLAQLGHTVAVITKSPIKENATSYAQGDIAAIITPADTTDLKLR